MATKGGGRIPSPDGLRAVSISLVLLAHLAGTRGFLGGTSVLWRFAELGVRVFFVISLGARRANASLPSAYRFPRQQPD